jgi:hypothetical protein
MTQRLRRHGKRRLGRERMEFPDPVHDLWAIGQAGVHR